MPTPALQDGLETFAERLSPDRTRDAEGEGLPEYAARISRGSWSYQGDFDYLGGLASRIESEVVQGGARIIVNMPGGSGKSELCSHYLPTYFLDRYPERNVLLISYGDDLATHYSRKVRNEIRDNSRVEVDIDPEKKGVSEFETQLGGEMRAVGIGGSLTGFHGDLIIVDDPIKNWKQAMSAAERRARRRWWEATLWDRRKAGASVVLIMTRWDTDDLAAWVEERPGDTWDVYKYPALMTEECLEENTLDTREPGEPLNPTLKPLDEVEADRENVSGRVWLAKYQQDPPEEAGDNALTTQDIIDRLRVAEKNVPDLRMVVVAVDPPGSETGDEAGIVADGFGFDGKYYLLADESLQGRPETWSSTVVELYDRLDADVVVGERNYGGDMVESVITSDDPGITYEGVTAKKSKQLRAQDISVLYNKKETVRHAGHFPELEDQLIKWTPAEDWSPDRLDAHVYALKYLKRVFEGGSSGVGGLVS